METIWFYLIRAFAIIGLIYMGLASAVLAVLIKTSWDRRHLIRATVTECPYCNGRGAINTDNGPDACPLCDGESAITVYLDATDRAGL